MVGDLVIRRHFPSQADGTVYLTEGGQETEIMYRFGHDFPEFAMFTLLDQPQAEAGVDLVTAMTFNSVPEAVGVARAAARLDLPLCISFTLDSETSRLLEQIVRQVKLARRTESTT